MLCRAKALLFPVEREEYFGLNLIEAGACGTPVIAFPRGAVPEIVVHGKTGFLGKNVEELIKYIDIVHTLDPHYIRAYVSEHFSSRSMSLRYIIVYRHILSNFLSRG